MKTPTIILLLFFQASLLSACHLRNPDTNQGRMITEKRNITGFNGINASTGITVYLTVGNTEDVEVSAGENSIKYVHTEVEDGVLRIYYKHNEGGFFNWNNGHRTIKVRVNAKKIESVIASSGSDVLGQNLISSDHLKVSSSSGATLKLEIATNSLDLSASSGADAELKGKATNLDGHASSGAGIKASGLQTETSTLDASSGADISVSISKSLNGHASSGASISYRGNPQSVSKDKNSGGSIESI